MQTDAEREKQKNRTQIVEENIEYVIKEKNDMKNKEIKILQWNADAFLAKKEEFRTIIKNKDIDIFLVQETKMITTDKEPNFPGYTTYSKPRTQVAGNEKNRGGGLLTGIKNTIPYHVVKGTNLRDTNDDITEWQTIEIPISKKEKLRITNIYIPPERAGDARGSNKESVVTTKFWPVSQHDMIAGDINAHSLEWEGSLQTEGDRRGIEKKRGEMVESWMANKDMICLNTGDATHTNRRTGKESTPDVSLVHYTQMDKYEWETLEELGGSDHKPILVTRRAEHMKQVNTKPLYKWNLDKADYNKYREQVEDNIPENYERKGLKKLEKILRKSITKAANTHIGKKEIRPDSKPAFSTEVKKKIRERDTLRKNIRTGENRKKWLEKCGEVKEMIRQEKENKWKAYIEDLDAKMNIKNVWKVVHNIDGRRGSRKKMRC